MKKYFNKYLEELDKIDEYSTTIFKDREQKDILETKLWDINQKFNAMLYHYKNVKRIQDKIKQKIKLKHSSESTPKKSGTKDLIIKTSFILKFTDERPLFELNAFLSACRSLLDYLAMVISRYVKGTDFNSIHKLVKNLKKKKNKHVLYLYIENEWVRWIEELKTYRDDLIHKITITSYSRDEMHVFQGVKDGRPNKKIVKINIPFFIPKKSKFSINTRMSRWFENEEFPDKDLIVKESHSKITLPNGTVLHNEKNFEKNINEHFNIELTKFMEIHIQNIENFLKTIFIELLKLNFKFTE